MCKFWSPCTALLPWIYSFFKCSAGHVSDVFSLTARSFGFYLAALVGLRKRRTISLRHTFTFAIAKRILNRRLRQLDSATLTALEGLAVAKLEELSEAAIDFSTATDLSTWLTANQ